MKIKVLDALVRLKLNTKSYDQFEYTDAVQIWMEKERYNIGCSSSRFYDEQEQCDKFFANGIDFESLEYDSDW